MRVPVILRVYTSPLVLAADCGRFWAAVAALGKNENSKGAVFSAFVRHLDLEPAVSSVFEIRVGQAPRQGAVGSPRGHTHVYSVYTVDCV